MHKDFYERTPSRERAQKPGAPGPPVRRRSPFGDSHRPSRPPSDQRKKTGNTPHQRDRYSPRNRDQDRRRTPRPRGEAPTRPRSTSPGARQSMHAGTSHAGIACVDKSANSHTPGLGVAKRKERPPLIPGYCAQ